MVEPIYLDLHIHTSEDADNVDISYDVDKLVENILSFNGDSTSLISITDHNTINRTVYEKLLGKNNKIKILLGVELHIRNYDDADLYHAHIFFKTNDIIEEIDNINEILNKLYPKKRVSSKDKNVPKLDDIVNGFDKYDFLILPHGGQNHSTFEKSIPHGVNFDNTLERTIYYNQFDGFTSRSEKGTQETIDYFNKLNISEFINLVTGTDNYNPEKYPDPKAEKKATDFMPTWMLAEPTFNGLRISLSEKNRLKYQKEKPEIPTQFIKSCKLNNEKIDMDVQLSPGLNVVIGESSSGKSLFIDSLYRNIKNDFVDSVYKDLDVEKIEVNNPQGFLPHYINQNFLIEKINDREIDDIDIIKTLFPKDDESKREVESKLNELKEIILSLVNSIEKMEALELKFKAIPSVAKLIYKGKVQNNIIAAFTITEDIDNKIVLSKTDYNKYVKTLDEIDNLKNNNLFMEDVSREISHIKKVLKKAFEKTTIKNSIKDTVKEYQKKCENYISDKSGENARLQSQRDTLIENINGFIKEKCKYYESLERLSAFDYKIETKIIQNGDNKLYIENELIITEEKIIDAINKYLKKKFDGKKVKELLANTLYKDNWKERPKVNNYTDLGKKIYDEFSKMNEEKYKIITRDDIDFDTLSPGWKTAVILDLVFSSTSDYAPLIIDQPEDNLASTYMNGTLIDAIHKTKKNRQVIIVSHTATIPMLGDAQNVIVCKNKDGKIVIKNAPLEGTIDGREVVDIVAKLTDGGKSSIKKRFKKYNLKKYRGE